MNKPSLPKRVAASTLRRAALSGFTLIEILVALAIVTVLSALVFQGTRAARNQVSKGRSVMNMKGIITAWNLYANDNNNLYPIGLTWTATADSVQNAPAELKTLNYRYWWRWYGGVAGYLPTLVVSDTEAANSYGGPKAPKGWDDVWDGYFPPHRIATLRNLSAATHVGYHFSTYMGYNRRIKRSAIIEPSKVPILFPYWDETSQSSPLGRYFSCPLATDDRTIFMKGAPKALGNGNHFAFADGHAEWVPAMATPQEYEARFNWRPY